MSAPGPDGLVLHGYWRSSAAYRVRIALYLKGLAFTEVAHDLRAGEQRAPGYLAIAPHGLVPTLQAGGDALIESPAILEWLEERHPAPPLLPRDAEARAAVRAMAAVVACDIHPLNNLRVLRALSREFAAPQVQIDAWVTRWVGAGFEALEAMVARHGGGFAFGDAPGLADCYLVPQVYNAERFKVDLTPYPRIRDAAARARALDAFAAAAPERQPGAEPA